MSRVLVWIVGALLGSFGPAAEIQVVRFAENPLIMMMHTTMDLTADWNTWKIGEVRQIMTPEAAYECLNLPNQAFAVGEIDRPARQLRDPALFSEDGKITLFYTYCGEQGVAAAEVKLAR